MLVLVGLALAASLLPAASASAAVISPNVFTDDNTTNGNCTLREAIIAANQDAAVDQCPAGSGADTIQLGVGTYTLGIPGEEEAAAQGDLDVTRDLTINGSGRAATIIDGSGTVTADRVFEIDPVFPGTGPTVVLSSLTIRGGKINPGGGGGIFNDNQGKLTLQDVLVTGNEGEIAAGIFNQDDSILTLTNSVVSNNTAPDLGGGIAIWNSSVATITDSTISGNSTGQFGGGIQIWNETTLTLRDSTVSGNSAAGDGGGIAVWNDPNITVANSTISGNTSRSSGGGIYAQETAAITLANATVTANTADSDSAGDPGEGGGLAVGFDPGGILHLRNSIVAGNSDPTSEPDCYGTISSQGYNLVGQVSPGCDLSATTGDQTGTTGSPLDPKLGPLADNGGPTSTHSLLQGSPAIDAGNPAAPGSGGNACEGFDQRGAPRNCDIGAYERVLCGRILVNRVGTDGKDKLKGAAGADGMLGLGGKDTLTGKGGKDGLCGGGGKDTLKGGGGKDVMKGQGGKDTCLGGGGKDKATCEKEKKVP
jgi:CSLREA domain-containing protein